MKPDGKKYHRKHFSRLINICGFSKQFFHQPSKTGVYDRFLLQMHSSGLVSCDRAKIWTDGGLGAKTAAMLEPYADDPENLGVLQMTGEQITKVPGCQRLLLERFHDFM